jgi:hypothetical protein
MIGVPRTDTKCDMAVSTRVGQLYVYAIGLTDGPQDLPAIGVAGTPVTTHCVDELAAVIGILPVGMRPCTLGHRRDHAAVIRTLAERRRVLPVAFGCAVSDGDAIADLLLASEHDLLRMLRVRPLQKTPEMREIRISLAPVSQLQREPVLLLDLGTSDPRKRDGGKLDARKLGVGSAGAGKPGRGWNSEGDAPRRSNVA